MKYETMAEYSNTKSVVARDGPGQNFLFVMVKLRWTRGVLN